ncbi:MAG: HU family DNA-binding protein [Bacilli bacterium]
MNKDDLIKIVAGETNYSKKEVSIIIESFFKEIVDALDKGEVVRLSNFGKFEIRQRTARIGVNPITKEPLPIAELKSISFHAAESVKNVINKNRK